MVNGIDSVELTGLSDLSNAALEAKHAHVQLEAKRLELVRLSSVFYRIRIPGDDASSRWGRTGGTANSNSGAEPGALTAELHNEGSLAPQQDG